MDASCGPSNALQNLNKHTQRDTSLQHEFVNRPQQAAPAFRQNQHVDPRLNSEFNQFAQAGEFAQPVFQGQLVQTAFQQQQHQFQQQPQTHQPQKQQPHKLSWVNDFSNMSLQGAPQKLDWHQQFLQQQPAQVHRPMGQAPMYRMQQNLQPSYAVGQIPSEHKEVHYMEQSKQLDDQFDQLEKELAEREKTEEMQQGNDVEKEAFANSARQVRDLMMKANQQSTETTEKFRQSEFLKLMTSISDRQVEISNEGDSLVHKATGQDIREHLPDPLQDVRQETGHEATDEDVGAVAGGPYDIDFHRPVHDPIPAPQPSQAVRDEHINHLPDPLAHIKDGDLGDIMGSLQAAQVVSGGQVSHQAWMEDDMWEHPPRRRNNILDDHMQEMYDDYRNDDDFH